MMNIKPTISGSLLLSLLTTVMVIGNANVAGAYGAEGMFGGRPSPDNTFTTFPMTHNTLMDRPDRAQSVIDHPRPDYDPVPLTAGSFDIYPSIELGGAFDSNIYSADSDTQEDFIWNARPAVSVVSNWNNHALAFTTFGDVNFYSDHSDENFNNFVAEVDGRYDVMAQTWIGGSGGYQHLTETRSSPDDVGGDEPTEFDVYKAGLSAYRGMGKLKVGLNYDLKGFSYDDISSPTGNIDLSYRDRNQHRFGGKLGYQMGANFQPYVAAYGNVRDYDSDTSRRDSNGYDAVVGAVADFGGITSIDAWVGWMEQDYDDFGISESNGTVKVGGRIEWNVTGMDTLAFEADRTMEETSLANYSSATVSGGSATWTHELMRNLLLEGNAGVTRYDYNGNDDRQDDVLLAGLGMRWFINQNVYTDVSYNWSNRMSDEDAAEYDRHIVGLRVGLQM